MTHDIKSLLRGNPYPGRGLVLGRSGDGARAVMLYFIMGRSENSRNRLFVRTDDCIRTKAHDPAKLTDPSLIIYHPVRIYEGRAILTNGDQTDTIRDYLATGRDFRAALMTREFEPDAPNYTPRISGLVEKDGSYTLSILKTDDGDPSCCLRAFFEYSAAIPGLGHFLCTYDGDGDPLPSFASDPLPVKIDVSGGLDVFASAIWDALDEDNRVSLYAREAIIHTGDSHDYIINKN